MQVENRIKTLALKLRNGYGDISFRKQLEKEDSLDELFIKCCITSEEVSSAEDMASRLHSRNVSWLCLWEDSYPKLLREIYDPPMILFYKGNADILLENTISIVGTRKISAYGKDVTKKLIEGLRNGGFVTVSGGAFGIDSKVHSDSINAGVKTVSVLGSDLFVPTPKSNQRLFDLIIENGGCLVSETLPYDQIRPSNFVKRNRIISGLSKQTIIIEAPEKSGALQTADFAFSQDREVFAIPNSIFSNNSKGSNLLIQNTVAEAISCIDTFIAKLANKTLASLPARDIILENASQESIVAQLEKESLDLESLIFKAGLSYTETIKTCSQLELSNIITLDGTKYKLKHT